MYDIDPDNTFDTINTMGDVGVAHYPFVLDLETRTVVAHSVLPSRVGVLAFILLPGGFATNPADEIIERLVTTGSTWEDYVFLNPVTGDDQLKRSWLSLHDGYIFGSGFYYPLEEKMVEGIQNSIDLFESEGEGAFDIITGASDKGKYASIFDPVEGVELANSRQPHRVGGPLPPLPVPWIDFAEILRDSEEPIWAYILINQPGRDPAQAAGLFDDYGDYLLVNGYTYPAESRVKRSVAYAIELYKAGGESAFEQMTQTSLDPHYPFVIDLETHINVAHGANPARVGEPSTLFDAGSYG